MPPDKQTHAPTEQEIRGWYDRRYSERGFNAMRTEDAYPVFLDDLGVRPGLSFLDIACGTGYLLKAAAGRGLVTSGIDISDEAVRLARETSPESDIRVGKGEELPFPDSSFDYIACLGSLEHFLDMEKGLAEMRRALRPAGLALVMVPNSGFLGWRVTGKRGTEQQDINEHLRSLAEWRAIFTANGFDVVRVRQDRWPARKVKNPLFRLVWSLLPLRWAYQFVFILRTRPG